MAKKKAKAKKVAAKSKGPVAKAKSKAAAKKITPKKVAASKVQPKAVTTSGRPKWMAEGSNPISAHLVVRNVEAALDFYRNAFGFKVRDVIKGPNNSIIHAEMTHRDSVIMMGPENPERGAFAPQGPSPVTLYVYVADVDAVADVARLHGGNIVSPPADMFWGDRCAVIIDTDGHSWMLATHVKDIPYDEMVPPPPQATVN